MVRMVRMVRSLADRSFQLCAQRRATFNHCVHEPGLLPPLAAAVRPVTPADSTVRSAPEKLCAREAAAAVDDQRGSTRTRAIAPQEPEDAEGRDGDGDGAVPHRHTRLSLLSVPLQWLIIIR